MKSKNILSIVIAAAVIFSSAPSVLGESNDKAINVKKAVEEKHSISNNEEIKKELKICEEEAKNIAIKSLKEYFGIEIDKNINLKTHLEDDFYEENDTHIWNFNWYENTSKLDRNISVSIDADSGKILSFHNYEFNNSEEKKLAAFTMKEAEKTAVEFINKINPKASKEVEVKYSNSEMQPNRAISYTYVFKRKINGVEILGDRFIIDIDGSSGKIRGYSSIWNDDITSPSKEGIISIEQAQKALEDNIDMHLYYNLIDYSDKSSNDNCGKLIYTFNYRNGFMIDAKSGEIIDNSINFNLEREAVDLNDVEKAELYKIAENNKKIYKKELSKEEAQAEAEKLVKALYGSGIIIENIAIEEVNYYGNKQRKIWKANFADDNRRIMGRIELDAENGGLVRSQLFGGDDNYENFEPAATYKEAHKRVLEMIAEYFPDKIKNIDTKQMESIGENYVNGVKVQSREYYFSFGRVENGIEVIGNDISAEFDIKTGKVTGVRINWDNDINLSDIKETVSKDEAKKLLTEKYNPVLLYTKINTSKDEKNPKMEWKLIYQLQEKQNFRELKGIDAVTRKYVDYKGEEIIEENNSLEKKIEGSKYKREITLLANSGIIDTNTFELNKGVSKIDLIKMLVNSKGYRKYILDELEEINIKCNIKPSDDDYQYLQLAVYFDFIDNERKEIDFNEKLNREETAKILAKALGYEKLSKAKEYFVINCKDAEDISDDAFGSAAICNALEIMELHDGKFEPKKEITMEEISKIIYSIEK